MKKKVETVRRILSVESQLYRVEQWKMAELERRLGELEAAQVGLIEALNDTNALHGLFIDTTARRLSAVAEEAERVRRERAAQSLVLKEHATRVKGCERLLRDTEETVDRDQEGKQLLDLVEQHVSGKRTSLP